jgi:hypothetical protein
VKVGDLVKFVDGKIIGLVVRTVNHTGHVQVLWLPARTPSPARVDRLEVISEGR